MVLAAEVMAAIDKNELSDSVYTIDLDLFVKKTYPLPFVGWRTGDTFFNSYRWR